MIKSVLYFMYSNPCNSQPRPNSIFPFHFPFKSFDKFQKTMNLHCNLLSSEDWKLRGGFHETTCKLGQSSSIKVIIFVHTHTRYLLAAGQTPEDPVTDIS